MATLPPSSDITSGTATEGDAKSWFSAVRTFIAQHLGTAGTVAEALTTLAAPFNSSITKTGAYTVVSTDRGKVIRCTGTWTLSFTAAATLGDGFVVAIVNEGAGVITIDPDLSETIGGSSTKTLAENASVLVCCNGTSFSTFGGGSGSTSGMQKFTASGTFTVPAGVTTVWLTGVGGGAGGAGSDGGAFGGGGGARAWGVPVTVTPGASYAVTIGAGGSPGPYDGPGGAGGVTSFGALLSLSGGGAGGAGGSGGGDTDGVTGGGFGGYSRAAAAGSGGGGSGGIGGNPGYAGGSGFLLVEW